MKKVFLFVFFCFAVSYTYAGGYGVSLQSQKFLGMAHAGTGLYLDGSAIFFNPGALAQQQNKWEFTFGGNALFAKGYYQNPETRAKSETDNPVGTPIEFYASYKINQKLTAGVGFYTPFGSGIEWPEGWEGRALITNIELKTYFVQPTLSYAINDWLSVGAGLVIVMGEEVVEKDIPAINGHLKLEGKANPSYGYNLGVYLQPTEKLSLGINYRSKIDVTVDNGDAIFTVPSALAGSSFITNDTFSASLPMISSLNLGVAYRINPQLTIAGDVNFNNWSEYEQLLFEFNENTHLIKVQERNYKNSITGRIGAQYLVNDRLTARAGFYYDPTPVRENFFSPETPSMNNLGFTMGGSFQASKRLGIDFSLLIINGQERRVGYKADNFWGDFRSFAISPGIGVTYSF
ncbi:long-chain fatty acid transport protein [Balneicella halophila]|uniref:Long-chain fatty acid transport protein n=1 Tax=Balneicella halophila TaxID=1537566 RepID=A0A7L4UQ56_BALHA|nr:outer membrane protein transport protein [Balneicella halophila]PVX51918.1 long-chain fatty acid transport protein [Balneicella halophila]